MISVQRGTPPQRFSVQIVLILSLIGLVAPSLIADGPIQVEIATIGHIYPESMSCLPYVAPPQDLAKAYVNRRYQGIFNFTITYIFDRTIPSCAALADHAVHLITRWFYGHKDNNTVLALIFAGCSGPEVVYMNQIAAAQNVLMITHNNDHEVIRNKALSPTFVSLAHYISSDYREFYKRIAEVYNWTSVYVVIDDTSVWVYTLTAWAAIEGIESLPNRVVTVKHILRNASAEIAPILHDFRTISRVMLFCGRAERLRTVLIQASELNMTNGEFVYITMENFHYKTLYGNLDWRNGDEHDQVVERAFASVLVIRAADYDNQFSVSSDLSAVDISRRAKTDYNFTLPINDQPVINLLAPFMAVKILAEILNRSNELHGTSSLHDGRNLANMFRNRTFLTEFGDIEIGPSGRRVVDLVLFCFETREKSFRPFLLFKPTSRRIEPLRGIVSWVNGNSWPPPNEPRCGFTGRLCEVTSLQTELASIATPIVTLVALCCLLACYLVWRHCHNLKRQEWWIIQYETMRYDDLPTGYLSLLRCRGE
ncbi:hypothetical protein BV898_17917 [Hypsibius exemplaris]|uniref:Receptor ligand binding region domain-containing protein n=1 Tax=Hypsibius exemplaris TaxID=2072580 RepID=A0A9X6NFX5_HYPEX|nr:hypothetical protein BV898_17917 [Hypsibius exemplaris]